MRSLLEFISPGDYIRLEHLQIFFSQMVNIHEFGW